jgi:hypothetical protein
LDTLRDDDGGRRLEFLQQLDESEGDAEHEGRTQESLAEAREVPASSTYSRQKVRDFMAVIQFCPSKPAKRSMDYAERKAYE